MAIGSFELRRDGLLVSSPEVDDLCGFPQGAGLHNIHDLIERVAVEQRGAVLNTLMAPVGVRSAIQMDMQLVRLDGALRDIQVRGRWIGPAATPVLVGILLEHPSGEVFRLAELAARYRTLTEVSPDIIVVHQDGKIVYANPATVACLRADDASQVVGKPILDFFSPTSQRVFLERISAMAETGTAAEFFEEAVTALDGTVIDIEATSILTSWEERPAYQAIARVITERKSAERELREQAALIDAVADAIVVSQGGQVENLRIVSWSKGAERLYGWSEDEVKVRPLWEVFGDRATRGASWWRKATKQGAVAQEGTHVTKDGTVIPVHLSATLLRDDDGNPSGVITVSSDISQRKAADAARRQLEDRYSAVVAALEEGIVVVGPDGRIQATNSAAERMLDVGAGRLSGADLSARMWAVVDDGGAPLPDEDQPHQVTLRTGKPQANVILGFVKTAGTTWVSINSRPLNPTTGPGHPVVCSISDITESRAARERLEHSATHDMLTGLPNRAGITAHLDRLTADGVTDLTALFVDLDGFKVINDSLGHPAGDQVLQHVAARLLNALRDHDDVVGRLAGDEFVVLCANLADPNRADVIAERLLSVIGQPFGLHDSYAADQVVHLSASIGLARLGADVAPHDLLINADMAMYLAKEHGGNRVETFDDALRERACRRLSIREDLRSALETSKPRVVYQPIVNQARRTIGYEALARWDHPTRGPIAPEEFIPIAEEVGLITKLGASVLSQAATAICALRAAGHDLYMSVNLSARQVADPDLIPVVRAALNRTGLPARALCLELTETSVMADAQAATVILSELKALGVMLAIDDFGTGYSSLAYLDKFPVDALKVDKSFIAALGVDAAEPTLVASMVSLAHSLNLSVIAEGVETETQARILTEIDVDAFQGYLYGRPGPIGSDPPVDYRHFD
ncbi:MAG: EAL domain-containing protein [Actinomycetota bacterium]|nr:EAL domain-containing protein [Actinomycetota bacterium]